MVFLGNNFVLLRLKRINRLSKYVNSGQSTNKDKLKKMLRDDIK